MNEIYQTGNVSNFTVNIDYYSGPLNALLEILLKKRDTIYQIRISEIIKEFVKFLDGHLHNRLEELSGFLYVISIMLDLKSKSLIPSRNEKPILADEPDTTAILKKREAEYRAFRKTSEYFSKLIQSEETYFLREAQVEEQLFDILNEIFKKIKIKDLHDAALRFLSVKQEKFNYTEFYGKKSVKNIFQEIKRIKSILNSKDNVSFKEITRDYIEMIDIVVAFLSILELYKSEAIDIEQFEIFGEIIIKKISA